MYDLYIKFHNGEEVFEEVDAGYINSERDQISGMARQYVGSSRKIYFHEHEVLVIKITPVGIEK